MPYPFVPGEILTSANLNAALDMRMLSTGTGMGLIPGAVAFGHATNGGFQTDSQNLFYDDVNDRFGIRTNTPQAMLQVGKTIGTARIYNAYADVANNEWCYLGDWTGGTTATFGSDKAGTGIVRDVNFVRGNVEYLRLATGLTASVGLNFGSVVAVGGALDLSRHIALWGTAYGFNVTSNRLNYVGVSHRFIVGAGTIDVLSITAAGIAIGGSTSGAVTLAVPAAASGTITLPAGTTNFSTTGGAGRVVKQLTAGGAFTVATLTPAEIVGLDPVASAPVLLGTTPLAAAVRGVCVMGNYAYTTNQSATGLVDVLEIFDITVPTAPVKVGGMILPNQGLGQPVVAGNILYTGCNVTASSLQIIDVSSPKAPSVLRSFNAGAAVQYLALSGAYLYVGYGAANATFRIYDISDPAVPIQKGNTSMPGASGTRTIVLQGKYAFVGTGQAVAGTGGLYIFDVGDPGNPNLIYTYDCITTVSGLCVSGKYLYLHSGTAANGIEVINIEDPYLPVLVTNLPITGAPNVGGNPILAGNNLYITTNSLTVGLQVINVSDPSVPALIGSVTTVASAFSSALRGDCIYVTANAQLRIYDIGGLDVPAVRTGSINTDNIYVDGQSNFNGDIYAMRGMVVGQSGIFSRGPIFTDASEALIPISAVFGNGLVCIGENAVTSPALKRSGTNLQVRTGTDSAHAPFEASTLTAGGLAPQSVGNLIEASAAVATAYASGTAGVGPRISILNTDNTDGNFSRILFPAYGSAGTYINMGAITCIHTSHLAGAESVAFTIQGRLNTVYAERLRLTGNNLGVGGDFSAKAPQAMLHVGTTAGSARSYNVFTDAANGDWAYLGDWSDVANVACYGTDKIGSGVDRDVYILRGGVTKLIFESAGVRVGDATRLSVGNPGGATNMATLFAVRDSTAIGATAGLYNYPFELHGFAGANVIRLQTTIYRRYAGAAWQGSGFRLQYAVDGSFTDGSRAFMEIGSDAAGSGQIVFGTQGGDRFSILPTGSIASTGALQVLGNTGATDNATLNVDAVAGGATAAKVGPTLPMYLLSGPPTIGFNVYWNAAWLFGKGSAAGTNYAGYLRYESTTGATVFASTTATGAANATAALQNIFQISNQGIVVLGPSAAFSNAFPALRRTGAALEVVLGDQSAMAALNAGTPAFGNSSNVPNTAYLTAYYMPLGGSTFTGGIDFGAAVAPGGATDLSRHIALYSTTYGFSVTSSTLNYVVPAGAHSFLVGGTSVLTVGNTAITANLAVKLTSASGATDFAPFNVDIVAGATSAKFGTTTPVYIVQGPIIGFNAYFDTAWKFGKGSTAHWGGYLTYDAAGAGYAFGSSTVAGAANAAATMQSVFRITTSGDRVTWGPACAFSSAFPALRRNAAAIDVVTADSLSWAALQTGAIGVQTGGITITSGALTVSVGNVQLNNGYLSTIASPPSLGAQTIYTYSIANTASTALMGNCYLDAAFAFKYRTATGATALNNDSGTFIFYTAPTGTIGATVGFTNRFMIGNTGVLSVNGLGTIQNDGVTTTGYTRIYCGDGANYAMHLGGTSDRTNHYRNTTHAFAARDADGAASYATIAAGGLTVTNTWLYLAGGSGAINVSSGPGVYGDANWLITKPGANNLGWMFQTYAGVNRFVFNGDGQAACNMPAGGLFTLNSVTGADCAFEIKAGTSFDWKLYGSSGAGNFWIYNAKTGALPLYITQTNQTVCQGELNATGTIYTGNAAVSLAGGVGMFAGGASQGGYTGYYNSAGTRLFYIGFHNSVPGLSIDSGSEFQVRGGGLVTTNGAIQSRGVNSILGFDNRSNTAVSFGWYSASSKAILWYSGTGDKFWFDAVTDSLVTIGPFTATTISTTGLIHSNTTINASQYNLRSTNFAETDASALRTAIYDPAGYVMLLYADYRAFYDNNDHWFRSRGGGSNLVHFAGANTYNTNGVWLTLSDASVKEDVKPWTHRGLDAISKLVPVSFKYKRGTPFASAPDKEQDTILGLIAQEVEKVVPELVGEYEGYVDGVKKVLSSTRPGQLVYVLINAVKELKERVEMLEAKLGEV